MRPTGRRDGRTARRPPERNGELRASEPSPGGRGGAGVPAPPRAFHMGQGSVAPWSAATSAASASQCSGTVSGAGAGVPPRRSRFT